MNYADVRREKLARYLAEGLPTNVAGRKAGYLSDAGAYQASKDARVQARVAEIVNEGIQGTLRAAADLDAILDDMLDADIRDFFDEDGRLIRPHQLRRAESLLLTGYKEGPLGPELKFESRLALLKLAMQRRGMLIEKHELTGKDGAPMQMITTETDAATAAELYKALL